MTDPVAAALRLWGVEGAPCRLVAGRENRVFRVDLPGGDAALRIRRPGYRTDAELVSELTWMGAMRQAGLSVPEPIPSRSGAFLERLGAYRADMLHWLPGRPLGESRAPLALADAPRTFARLGATLARLHDACDAWHPPEGFRRVAWNRDGLLGENPVWGRFWDNPTLSPGTRALMLQFRDRASKELAQIAGGLDYGLIHADPVRENVLLDGPALHLIDFDDGGWGFRLFDIATALLKNRAEPAYPDLQQALLEGYLGLRPVARQHLGLFLALRATTYVGWIVPRLHEDGAAARNLRFIADAEETCAAWLAG